MSEDLKAKVGEAVCKTLHNGMKLGIGTGSTAEAFVRALAKRVKAGLDIVGVPTSERTAQLCLELGISLTTLDDQPRLDLTIDGADEIDDQFALTKGGGGALLREKIVADASASMFVIADDSKLVAKLGAFPLPIEINQFGSVATISKIQEVFAAMRMQGQLTLRKNGDEIYLTDGGHWIVDASFGLIDDANLLDRKLLAIPGVVQHGLFIDMADKAFIASPEGVKVLEKPN